MTYHTDHYADLLGESRGLLRVMAYAFVAFGVFTIFVAPAANIIVGFALFICGLLYVAHAFLMKSWRGFIFDMIRGWVNLAFGFIVVHDPLSGIISLGVLLALLFASDAVAKIYQSITYLKNADWYFGIVSGVLSAFIAVLMLTRLPESVPVIVSVVVGVNIIISGIGLFPIVNIIPDKKS